VYGVFLLLPSRRCCGHPRYFSQLSSSHIFKRGRVRDQKKKNKLRKKLNFIRERKEEEEVVKRRRRKLVFGCSRAEGRKREKVTVKQLFVI
jgi:hypothetical protein